MFLIWVCIYLISRPMGLFQKAGHVETQKLEFQFQKARLPNPELEEGSVEPQKLR